MLQDPFFIVCGVIQHPDVQMFAQPKCFGKHCIQRSHTDANVSLISLHDQVYFEGFGSLLVFGKCKGRR